MGSIITSTTPSLKRLSSKGPAQARRESCRAVRKIAVTLSVKLANVKHFNLYWIAFAL